MEKNNISVIAIYKLNFEIKKLLIIIVRLVVIFFQNYFVILFHVRIYNILISDNAIINVF